MVEKGASQIYCSRQVIFNLNRTYTNASVMYDVAPVVMLIFTLPPHKGRYKISKGVGNQHEIENVNNAIVVYIFFTFPHVPEPCSNQD